MPTVKVKGMKRTFPYNAVGKAQADSFAKSLSRSIKEAVIETFKMHKKTSYRSIADVFNRKGLKTDRGGKWHGNTIQRACERIGLDIHSVS